MMKPADLHRWQRGAWSLLLAATLCGQHIVTHAVQRTGHAPVTSVAKAKAISLHTGANFRKNKHNSRPQVDRPRQHSTTMRHRVSSARVPSASSQRLRSKLKRARPVQPSTYRVQQRIALKRQDFQCLARNIYHEARGEPRMGKLAVAQITLNRVQTGTWGKSVCQVVYAPSQFSWTGQPNKRRIKPQGADWDESVRVAQAFLAGERVRRLEASTHFHSQSIRPPGWTRQMRLAQQVGQHIFFHDGPT